MYNISFTVKGDSVARGLSISDSAIEADSLDEMAKKSWDLYKKALRYIYKDMESAVFMEVRPNALLTAECSCDGQPINEEDALRAYFKIRIDEYNQMRGKYFQPPM